MIDTWTALTLAINVLRDAAESRRMPSGIALDPDSVAVHLDAAECLETLRDATLDNPMTDRVAHPEAMPDELWIGNLFASDFPSVGWRTKRLGRVAYETSGKTIPNFRPVFVKRCEIEEAGIVIPVAGPIDHRW